MARPADAFLSHNGSGNKTPYAQDDKLFLPQISENHFFFWLRMTATEHPALWTTLLDTLPRDTPLGTRQSSRGLHHNEISLQQSGGF